MLAPTSPGTVAWWRLGFQPFDYTKAGRVTPATMTRDLPPVLPGFDSPEREE